MGAEDDAQAREVCQCSVTRTTVVPDHRQIARIGITWVQVVPLNVCGGGEIVIEKRA
jgi:hypothetical protein